MADGDAKALAGPIGKLYDEQKVRDPNVLTETIKVSDGQDEPLRELVYIARAPA